MTLFWKRTVGAIALALLSACALLSFTPDRSARAPLLDGFGAPSLAITTATPQARQWFDQGLAQAYAFNEVEAVRAFKAALAADPTCAMCAWGVAYQLGPNINAPQRGDLSEAVKHIGHAVQHMSNVSATERALIEALAVRYAHGSATREVAPLLDARCGKGGGGNKAHPLDIAYADKMRALADLYPSDPDVVSMYAEAELIATQDDWWDAKTGKPAGRIGEVADRLERALVAQPNHTGLNHYLIHTVDAVAVAHRAVPAADRLGRLAPKSPHLLHMPSHTYVNVGRYGDATRVNEEALAADAALAEAQKAQGFAVSKDWRGHNGRFLWYAALMQGRAELALQTVRASAQRADNREGDFLDYVRALPLLTLLRLERWDEVLREPQPSSDKGLAVIFSESSRGVAFARSAQTNAAKLALERLEPLAAAALKKHAGDDDEKKMFRAFVEGPLHRLRAEVAAADARFDEAITHQTAGVKAVADVDNNEPPMLAAGARLALGELQLRAGRVAEAEKSFRQDLAERPGSGWALRGLALAARGTGHSEQAAQFTAQKDAAWAQADDKVKTGLR